MVGRASDGTETVSLTANSTNHVFVRNDTGALEANTTGTAPTSDADDSIKLFELTTDSNGVPSTDVDNGNPGDGDDDFRDDTITFAAPFEADNLAAITGDKLITGGDINLSLAEPEILFEDTTDGTKSVIVAENAKLRVYDEDGAGSRTLVTDDLRDIIVDIGDDIGSGTADRILFVDSSGNLGQNANLQFSVSNNRVTLGSLTTLRFGADVNLSRGAVDRLDLGTGDDLRLSDTGELQWSDISLSRGGANRLDLASGDSLRLSDTGQLQWSDITLSRGATNRLDLGSGDSLRLSDTGQLQWSDITLSRGAASRLDLATGDSLRISNTGQLQFGSDIVLDRSAVDVLHTPDSFRTDASVIITNAGAGTDPTLSSNNAAQVLDLTGDLEVSGLATDNALVHTNAAGLLEVDSNLTWDGSTFTIAGTNNLSVSGTSTLTGNVTVSSDITDGTITIWDGTANEITDTAHGDRAGGSLHALAVAGSTAGFMSASDKSKLDGIESGATADQTAADIRALGFFDTSNDGSGSGLDADTVDGEHASAFANASHNHSASDITSGTFGSNRIGNSVRPAALLTHGKDLTSGRGIAVGNFNSDSNSDELDFNTPTDNQGMPMAHGGTVTGASLINSDKVATFELYKNGSATGFTVTSSANGSWFDGSTTGTVSFNAGDRLAWVLNTADTADDAYSIFLFVAFD